MKKYKVVAVNYNKNEAVKTQLLQLSQQTAPPASVCIVDNSPVFSLGKGENEKYGLSIEVHHHPENIGYSKACNSGCNGAWDYVVFLNPDIEIPDHDLFEKLMERIPTLDNPGCIGVAQHNPDGTYEPVARRFPSIPAIIGKRVPSLRKIFSKSVNSYMRSYSCDYSPNEDPLSVDWLQSSFLVVPRSVWERLGGFDERFFVFMADTEYGLRCHKNGFKSYLIRDLQVEADGLRSSAGGVMDILRKKTIRIHLRDAFRYYSGF